MKTQVMRVTPKMAREWLKTNTDNRPLRRLTVEGLKAAWLRGEWRLTHQGIAFGRDGKLKDGQHRLTFISELPESAAVPLLVTQDLDDDVFGTLDIGVRRSPADVLRVDTTRAGVAAFLAGVYNFNQRNGVTPQYLVPFVEWSGPYLDDLFAFCGSRRQTWTSAPVLSAAVIQLSRGHDADYIKLSYRSLVMTDTTTMPPAAAALLKQVVDGKTGGSRSTDLFARSLRAFDSSPSKAGSTKLRALLVKDLGAVMAEVREYLETIFDCPKLPAKKKARNERAEEES